MHNFNISNITLFFYQICTYIFLCFMLQEFVEGMILYVIHIFEHVHMQL